jgi:Sortase domain
MRLNMNILRYVAIASFATGVAVLVYGFAASGGGGTKPVDDEIVSIPFPTPGVPDVQDAVETETPAADATATPTPEPYRGAVARLKIPRFDVDSAIEGIGVTSDGRLDTPHDPLNTGWYEQYDRPGATNPANTGWLGYAGFKTVPAKGNAVFSAHVDYWPNIIGPFNKLKNIEKDDEIVVVMEDGREYVYRVIGKERYHVDNIPMGDLIWPKAKPKDEEWITLITCGGAFQASRPGGPGEYLERDVVLAKRVE